MQQRFELEEARAIQAELETRVLKNHVIFERAREANVVVMTKDRDFVDLVERLGPPPQGDPDNDRIRLDTLTAAAHVLGLTLRIELVQ